MNEIIFHTIKILHNRDCEKCNKINKAQYVLNKLFSINSNPCADNLDVLKLLNLQFQMPVLLLHLSYLCFMFFRKLICDA